MLQGKIHRATVTSTDLNYEGSITIDALLLEAANISPFEQVQVVNLNNGQRFETYTIVGSPGSGVVQLNGASARLAQPGDLVIIMSYLQVEEPVPLPWEPRVVFVDQANHLSSILEPVV